MVVFIPQEVFGKKPTIKIKIDGESYEREYPVDLEEAYSLINTLAEMINNSDDMIVSMRQNEKDQNTKYQNQIDDLSMKLNEANNKLINAGNSIVEAENIANKFTKLNYRFTPFMLFGPVIGTDKEIGLHLEFGGQYRLIRNLQVGAALFSSVYQGSADRNFDIGCGLILAYSMY